MVEGDVESGDHVVGEGGGEVGAELGGGEGGVGDEVGEEAAVAVVVVVGGDEGFVDVGVGGEGGFDFAEFDAVAADFDLVVGAAEVFEGAVGEPAGEVARSVHTRTGGDAGAGVGGVVGVGGEAFGGELGAVEVAACESVAGDVDFAGYAGGDGVAVGVQEADLVAGQGASGGQASALCKVVGGDHLVGDVDRGLRDPVHVDQLGVGVRVAVEPGLDVLRFQCLTAEDDPPQIRETLHVGVGVGGVGARSVADEFAEHGRGLAEEGDLLLFEEVPHGFGVAGGVVGDDDGSCAGGECAPEFPDGEVEGVGVEDGPDVVGAEAVEGLGVGEEVEDGVVFDGDALGAAGGA